MAPTSGDDQPLPLRELARRAGIAEGTVRNWARLPDRPLRTKRTGRRTVRSTVADMRAFCAMHPELRATRTAVARLDSPATALDPPAMRELLEAVLRAVRAATVAHLELAQSGVEQTEHVVVTCRVHAAALSRALNGLDDVLTRLAQAPRDTA